MFRAIRGGIKHFMLTLSEHELNCEHFNQNAKHVQITVIFI